MIDFDKMEEYLDARKTRRYFIPKAENCKFTHTQLHVLMFIMSKYGNVEFSKCFEPNEHGKSGYQSELYCNKCGEMFYAYLSKTKLIELIKDEKNFRTFQCLVCTEENKKKINAEREIWSEKYEETMTQRTEEFIKLYLDPDMSWNEQVKTWERWQTLISFSCSIYWEIVKDHIKSMKYYDFLKTPYWKAISAKKVKQADYRCQLCDQKGKLATHHRTYSTHGMEMQNLNDLIVLCDTCHSKFHGKYNIKEENGNP